MKYELHPAAEKDLANAYDFYLENGGHAVATRFLQEFERALALLGQQPRLGTPSKGRRILPMRLFPYAIVYREGAPGLLVLVVRHQRRRPGYGTART